MKTVITSIKMLITMTILTGVAYPFLISGVAWLVFPFQAGGSLVQANGRVVGSILVGQKFESNNYFWPRPSAVNYNPMPSGGSNMGPTSASLKDSVAARRQWLERANGNPATPDLLCTSASGLDPDISPEAARSQVDRVVSARHLDANQKTMLIELIDRVSEGPDFMVFGEPRVNVLRLNLALDSLLNSEQ